MRGLNEPQRVGCSCRSPLSFDCGQTEAELQSSLTQSSEETHTHTQRERERNKGESSNCLELSHLCPFLLSLVHTHILCLLRKATHTHTHTRVSFTSTLCSEERRSKEREEERTVFLSTLSLFFFALHTCAVSAACIHRLWAPR